MKNIYRTFLGILLFILSMSALGQDYYSGKREGWLQKAEKPKPQLLETIKYPSRIVNIKEDKFSFQF